MDRQRRRFLQWLALTTASGVLGCERGSLSDPYDDLYTITPFGDLTLLHLADTYGQFLPAYDRPPGRTLDGHEANIGLRAAPAFRDALNPDRFIDAARRLGPMGGFAHIATLLKSVREQRPGRTVLCAGGDGFPASGLALWSEGAAARELYKRLGVDAIVPHTELLFGAEPFLATLSTSNLPYIAHNLRDDVWGNRLVPPYTLHAVNGSKVAILGHAYSHFPRDYPPSLCPEWRFDSDEASLQAVIDDARAHGAQIVVLISQQGYAADVHSVHRLRGIDVVFAHGEPRGIAPTVVNNAAGRTLVVASGAHGRFMSVLDLKVKRGEIRDYRYRLVPVYANAIAPDRIVQGEIARLRAPFAAQLDAPVAGNEGLLYRQDAFGGSVDSVITAAMRTVLGADIALSPGYRHGRTLLPGQEITTDALLSWTASPFPACDVSERTGEEIKSLLEQFAERAYGQAPLRARDDMLRVGGLRYRLRPGNDTGRRIDALTLGNGVPLEPNKTYRVAITGIGEPRGERALSEVLSEYLRNKKILGATAPIASPIDYASPKLTAAIEIP